DGVIVLDTRGQISGTLFDDAAKTTPIGGGVIQLTGNVNGRLWGTRLTALSSTSLDTATLGQFLLDGIPVGNFTLTAAINNSPRRAAATLDLTSTAPVAFVDLVLEPVADRYVRLFQNLIALPHLFELDPSTGIFSVQITQSGYDFTLSSPTVPYPSHLY